MLTELEIERIERDLKTGVDSRRLATWVERLLRDRDERILHEREVAVQLLATAPIHPPAPTHTDPPAHPHRPRAVVRA